MAVLKKGVSFHLPRSTPIDIEFKDITFTVSEGLGKNKKQILKSVSGRFESGELTAIMGPSGAGKSSLLNILTGFQTYGMTGTIRTNTNVSNMVTRTKEYRKKSCYILQDDQLAPLFTVMEIMTIASNLKLGSSMPEKAKQLLINDILECMGLSICIDTRCERLSGGQKKRLSIALELIDNPPVMFLDEPTTGLDSSSSMQCLLLLKALAQGGRTIICTIHQPSASLFEMFDHVYVLAEGQCLYQGASHNTVPYLASLGLNCPKYHNSADYLIEVVNKDYGDFSEMLAIAAQDTSWRTINHMDKGIMENKPSNKTIMIGDLYGTITPPSEWTKFFILSNKIFVQLYRDWTVTHLKVLLHFMVGILLGLYFLNIGNDGSKTISNIGYCLVVSVYLSYTAMMPAVLRFPSEIPVLKKEQFNNWYNLRTYYVAFILVDLPVQLLFCTVLVTVSYILSDQPLEWDRFSMYLGISVLINLTFESLGHLLGTTVKPVNGTFLGAITTATMLVFAGFLILFTHMPRYMYWISYLSYFRYALEGIVISLYGYERKQLKCPEVDIYCQHSYPKVLLDEIGMFERYWFDFSVLLINLILLKIITFISLKRKLGSGS